MDALDRPSYGALFSVPGLGRLATATVLARVGASMQALVLVLFVLQRFHSPPLAGLVVFLGLVPGLLLSPLAGALLDRHRRVLLISVDYAVAAVALGTIAGLDALGRLPAGLLLLIVAVGSLTNPLSNSGTRTLFPTLVHRRLWERANAVDSGAYVVASIAGPAVAGLLVGVAGARIAMLATSALYVASLIVLVPVREPETGSASRAPLWREALAGLRYVVHHRQLRALALVTSVSNVAFGIVTVAMPVLVLNHLNAGAGSVGLMYVVMGISGLVAGTLAGRTDSEHREARNLVPVFALAAVVDLLAGLAAAAMLHPGRGDAGATMPGRPDTEPGYNRW